MMDKTYMRTTVARLTAAARFKLNQERIPVAPARRVHASTLRKLDKYEQVFDYIEGFWDGDLLVTQEDICLNCRDLGCHELFEARVPDVKKQDSSKRMVRELIEDMRKDYGFPILSTPAVKSPEADDPPPAGYWVARSQAEVDRYILWKTRTTKAMCQSMIATLDAQCDTFGVTGNRFARVTAALNRVHTTEIDE